MRGPSGFTFFRDKARISVHNNAEHIGFWRFMVCILFLDGSVDIERLDQNRDNCAFCHSGQRTGPDRM